MPNRESLELDFTSIVDESLNEVYIFDLDSLKFIYVNQGAQLNNGYSMTELRSMTPVDIKPAHDEKSFRSVIEPLVSGSQQQLIFETTHQRKDGSIYPVEVHLQRRQFETRGAFVAIILDISERKIMTSELELSRSFLQSAPDAMVVVDNTGKIQLANKQMVNLFGYSSDELKQMNVDQFVPMRLRGDHAQHRAEFADKPRVRSMGSDLSLTGVAKDGREVPIEVSLSPIESGADTFVAAAIRDVTERKATEDALIESQHKLLEAKEVAEQATATKTRFLAAASHDLRQPLQALRLYLSALTNKIDEPKAIQLSEKMHLSLDTMGGLMSALLDISMLESGSIEPDKQDFLLSTLLEKILIASAPQATQKNIELSATNKDFLIHTDSALLQRIVENFITNALRYTETGAVNIDCLESADNLIISITDTGVGIPDDKLEKVFDEYYQIDNAVRDRRKGLGLGLSIVKHIANLLELKVYAKSTLGKGSTFSVEVPLSDTGKFIKSQTQLAHSHEPDKSKPTVLIIDDDVVIIDAMAEVLGTYDIRVHTAESGQQALQAIDAGLQPDLVISDYRMPGMTGIEVVEEVRRVMKREIPVIIMTGDASFKQIKEAQLTKCSVLRKPIDLPQLIEIIDSIKPS